MSGTKPPGAPRIAISFGGTSNSSTSKNNGTARPKPSSALGKRSRPSALGHDSDSESDNGSGDRRHGKHEAITEFGERESQGRPKELVIERQGNRDWKSELRAKQERGEGSRRKNLLPAEAQAQAQHNGHAETKETEPADGSKDIQWGLTVKRRKTSEEPPAEAEEERPPSADGANADGDSEENFASSKPQTADDDAMDALLGKKKKPSEERVIRPSEDDAYREDVEQHVGVDSTLEDYDAIPDGEFGAALLRGMGWDGKMRGPKPKASGERRQNQLGLGAKRLKDAEDLGQWNQGGRKKKDSRPPRLDEYRREEEKKKAERRERRGEGYRAERDRERERDRGDRDKYDRYDRERERDRHRDGRDRDSQRHRSGDSRRY